MFSEEQVLRYSRQIVFPEVGGLGQEKLLNSKVICVGAGGLGSSALLYLAAAGVGRIGIVDSEKVDLSNLQRQVIHFTKDVGRAKSESAEEKVRLVNPDVEVVGMELEMNADNVMDLISGYDLVIDGTDNFPSRYLLNDACYFSKKPLFHGAVYRFEGQASTFTYTLDSPCYRCLYSYPPPPELIPTCREGGVIGPVVGIIGLIQATEVIKHILAAGTLLVGSLIVFDGLRLDFKRLTLARDPDCPLCGKEPVITSLQAASLRC